MTAQRLIEAPRPTPETEAFWAAANQGQLLIKHCQGCGRKHYPPRTLCPHCFSPDTDWHRCSGTGTVYTYSIVRRTPIPYVMAYVRLSEGPTMMTNLVDMTWDRIAIGQTVHVTFRPADNGQLVPFFTTPVR